MRLGRIPYTLQPDCGLTRGEDPGMTIIASTPEAFAAYINEELARRAKVVKANGIEVD